MTDMFKVDKIHGRLVIWHYSEDVFKGKMSKERHVSFIYQDRTGARFFNAGSMRVQLRKSK